jgi:hypothetical protein
LGRRQILSPCPSSLPQSPSAPGFLEILPFSTSSFSTHHADLSHALLIGFSFSQAPCLAGDWTCALAPDGAALPVDQRVGTARAGAGGPQGEETEARCWPERHTAFRLRITGNGAVQMRGATAVDEGESGAVLCRGPLIPQVGSLTNMVHVLERFFDPDPQ